MSDDSGSYMRFTKDHHFPSSRPHNTLLSKLVVPKQELEGNIAERGLSTRPQNNKLLISNQRTMFDREGNNAVAGGYLSGVPTPTLIGGKLKYAAGWNKQHPRLSRDPTWFPGRGKQRAVDVFGNVAKTVEGAGKIAAAVAGGGSFLTGNHPRLARDPTWYRGRGKQRAVDVFGNVAKTVEGVGNIAAAVAGGSLKRRK